MTPPPACWRAGWFALLSLECAVEPLQVSQGGSSGTSRGGASATQTLGASTQATVGGSIYTACTGRLEELQTGGRGLCVAKMARIAGPSGGTVGSDASNDPSAGATSNPNDYRIDVTEVTRGQYEAWVASNPELPSSDDVNCSWKRGAQAKKYAATEKCLAQSKWKACLTNCEHHPQICVDWCDAYAYCESVEKRLCGRIGGGPNQYDDYDMKDLSQWYRACSDGGTNRYPYADAFDANVCRGHDYPAQLPTVEVGSLTGCVTATGVYDLSGNVREWEDSCDADGGCRMRGGSFGGLSDNLRCTYAIADNREEGGLGSNRAYADTYVGFRCCSR